MGPPLAATGMFGYCARLTLILLDTGNVFEYPSHFFIGTLIAVLLITTFVISRMIKGQDSPFRTPHVFIGIALLCLYVIGAFLGIGILF